MACLSPHFAAVAPLRAQRSKNPKPPSRTPTSVNAFFSLKTNPPAPPPSAAPGPPAAETKPQVAQVALPPPYFAAVPSSYFSYEQQTVKGLRANNDVGTPADASRPFVKGIQGGQASCGSWGCTEGGWLSPKPRTSTEWFYVLAGRGSVQTPDGREFRFGPGDLVVLPRGWSGRWGVQERIHKIWVVHEHDDIAGTNAEPVVATAAQLNAGGGVFSQQQRGVVTYDVGATRAGSWHCAAGASFPVTARPVAEVFTVTKGALFLTNPDGSARRCGIGDTVHLPEGWDGRIDVVESVTTVFAEIARNESTVTGDVETKYTGGGGGMSKQSGGGGAVTSTRASASTPIYEVGPAVPVPVWGHGGYAQTVSSETSAKYELCLNIIETSDDEELKNAAKAKLLAFLD